MACTYQTINLQPGESFVLPPGAELIGATDTAQLSSANDCLDLANVESSACYFIEVSKTYNADTPTQNYENVDLIGIRLNNTFISFSAPISVQQEYVDILNSPGTQNPELSAVKPQLINILGNVLLSWNALIMAEADYGTTIWYVFKTLPSIVQDLAIVGSTSAGWGGGGFAGLQIDFICKPISEFDPGDASGIPDLSTLCPQV